MHLGLAPAQRVADNRAMARAFQDRWSTPHAVLCLGAIAAGWLTQSVLPLAGMGTASLLVLFAGGRPRARRLGGVGVANAVTLIRVLLLAGVATVAPTPWGFAAVLLLDGVDGALARRLGEVSEFGARFDVETDALFVALLSTVVALSGHGAWVLASGVLRYALVLARAAFPAEEPRERRTPWGRWVFVLSSSALLGALLPLPERLRFTLLAVGLGLLVVSFVPDFAALRRTKPQTHETPAP